VPLDRAGEPRPDAFEPVEVADAFFLAHEQRAGRAAGDDDRRATEMEARHGDRFLCQIAHRALHDISKRFGREWTEETASPERCRGIESREKKCELLIEQFDDDVEPSMNVEKPPPHLGVGEALEAVRSFRCAIR
jgi:hypothetical protein